MIRKVTSAGVLTNPIKLFNLLDAGTKSLTTDQNLSDLSSIQGIAESMVDIRPSDITFVTVPFTYNDDMSTVSWDQARQTGCSRPSSTTNRGPSRRRSRQARTHDCSPAGHRRDRGQRHPAVRFAAIVADDLTAQGYNVVGCSSDKDVAVTRLSYSREQAEAADPGLRGRCHADEGQGRFRTGRWC